MSGFVGEILKGLIPLERLGTAEDVARVVLFLASDDADWITGAALDVNGGQIMG
jgi:3-oxoacyl-[acyl-carrier protein] reductase